MATPMRHLPSLTLPNPVDESETAELDDVFLPLLAKLASLPIRRGGETVAGLLRDDDDAE